MFFNKKDKDAPSKQTLELINGKRISYISERENGTESVIGRTGGITVTNEEIIVVCDGTETFRCLLKGARVAELMSKNGVDIKAEDAVSGKVRKVTAYFSNLRQ